MKFLEASIKNKQSNKDKPKCEVDKQTTNQGCVFMSKNDLFSRRVKHIDVGYYFVQESVNQFKEVDVIKIDTNANPADCLTKPLAKEKLDDFRTLLMHVESAK